MDHFSQIVIPAIAGLLSGGIASLVAPWVHWGIERKRDNRTYKRDLIRRWREFLATDLFGPGFSGTVVYSEMRPHLSKATRDSIEGDTVTIRDDRGGDVIHSLVLDDIARLEKEWHLI